MLSALALITVIVNLPMIKAQAIVATATGTSVASSVPSTPAPTSEPASDDSTNNGTCSYDGSVSAYLSCQKSKVSTTALVCGGIGVTLSILLIVFGGIFLCQRGKRRGGPKSTDLSAYAEEEGGNDEDEKSPVERVKKDERPGKRGVRKAGMSDKAAMVESGTDEEMGTPPPPFRAIARSSNDSSGSEMFRPAPPSLAMGERQRMGDMHANSAPRSQAQAQAQARYHAQVQAQTRTQAQNPRPLNQTALDKDLPPQPILPSQNPLETEIQAKQSASPAQQSTDHNFTPPDTDTQAYTEPSEIVNSPSPANQPRTLYPSNPDVPPSQSPPRTQPPAGNRAPPAIRQSSYNKRQSMASVHFAPPALPPPTAAPPLPLPVTGTRPALQERDTFGSPPSTFAPLKIRKSSAPTVNSGIPSYYDPQPRPGGGRRPSAPSFYNAKPGQSIARPASRIPANGVRPGMIMRAATEGGGEVSDGGVGVGGKRPSGPGGLGGDKRPAGGRKGSEDRGGMI